MADEQLGILEQRRIEAGIIKPIYEEMKAELGVEAAQRILGNAIKKAAIEAGRRLAAEEPDGPSLSGFAALQPRWLKGDALQIRMITPAEPPPSPMNRGHLPLSLRSKGRSGEEPSGPAEPSEETALPVRDANGLPPTSVGQISEAHLPVSDAHGLPSNPPGEPPPSPMTRGHLPLPLRSKGRSYVGQVSDAEAGGRLEYDVTRCRYAEMYKEMGLGEIGHLLSCNRDASFIEGYDPRIKLTRTQTIMQGASHCDFRYKVDTEAVT